MVRMRKNWHVGKGEADQPFKRRKDQKPRLGKKGKNIKAKGEKIRTSGARMRPW